MATTANLAPNQGLYEVYSAPRGPLYPGDTKLYVLHVVCLWAATVPRRYEVCGVNGTLRGGVLRLRVRWRRLGHGGQAQHPLLTLNEALALIAVKSGRRTARGYALLAAAASPPTPHDLFAFHANIAPNAYGFAAPADITAVPFIS